MNDRPPCVACGGMVLTEQVAIGGRWVVEEKCLSCGRPTSGPRAHEHPGPREPKLGQQGASERTLKAEW